MRSLGMKLILMCSVCLLAMMPATATASPPPPASEMTLRGQVFRLGRSGETIPEKGLPVSLAGRDQGTVTNDEGFFVLQVSSSLEPGDAVKIEVEKEGWRIPADGLVRLPADLRKDLIRIELLPLGSRRFLAKANIEIFLGEAIPKLVRGAMTEPAETDFERLVSEWARAYGLNPVEAEAEIDLWASEVQRKPGSTERELGLAAVVGGRYDQAAFHFGRAARMDEAELARIDSEAQTLMAKGREVRRELASRYWDQGTANNLGLQFEAAIAQYQEALKNTHPESGETSAAIRNDLGIALQEHGIRFQGSEAIPLLDASIFEFQGSLAYYTRERQPETWATVENNLGNSLHQKGIRSDGQSAGRLLEEAVVAYRKALEVRSRDKAQLDWVATQNNLGNTLRDQGTRSSGEKSVALLGEAVATFRGVLEGYGGGQPELWATIQNNLGVSLQELAKRSAGEIAISLLQEAAEAYRKALEIRTRDRLPQEWAQAQNNLGIVLQELGSASSGDSAGRLLEEAATAYRASLEIRTRERLPQEWAGTQNNLGIVLKEMGMRSEGENAKGLLAEAIAAYGRALEVRTREHLPQDWAQTQNNLGAALAGQASRSGGDDAKRLLAEAVVAHQHALEIYSREHLPQDWALTQNNLGVALGRAGTLAEGGEASRLLGSSVSAYRNALEIFTRDQMPGRFFAVRANQGLSLEAMGLHTEAARAFEEALEIQPDHQGLVHSLILLQVGGLHDPAAAVALGTSWLLRHPEDPVVPLILPAAFFATKKFAESEERSARLLANPSLDPRLWSALMGYDIAARLAQNQAASSLERLDELVARISLLPPDFRTGFTFEGTLYFVQNEPDLAHREFFSILFRSLEAPNQAALLAGMKRLQDLLLLETTQ
jgi:tetratricopeptide (TPR) repeat protein